MKQQQWLKMIMMSIMMMMIDFLMMLISCLWLQHHHHPQNYLVSCNTFFFLFYTNYYSFNMRLIANLCKAFHVTLQITTSEQNNFYNNSLFTQQEKPQKIKETKSKLTISVESRRITKILTCVSNVDRIEKEAKRKRQSR